MTMPLQPPFAITGAYQNSQMADGTYTQGGSQVFSHLVSPPVSGVAAELASDDAAAAAGYVPGAAVNEVQTISIAGTPTTGAFPVTFRGKAASIAYNSTSAAADTALEALSSIGTGNVAVTGGPLPGTALTVTFGGALAGQNVPRLSVSKGTLDVGTPSVAQTTPGRRASVPGVTPATNPAIRATYEQRDAMKDFYDSASGNR
jgi:hypothetical protein